MRSLVDTMTNYEIISFYWIVDECRYIFLYRLLNRTLIIRNHLIREHESALTFLWQPLKQYKLPPKLPQRNTLYTMQHVYNHPILSLQAIWRSSIWSVTIRQSFFVCQPHSIFPYICARPWGWFKSKYHI